MINSRYPYTYAADYLRSIAGYQKEGFPEVISGAKLSRADASRIRRIIAEIIGMDDEDLAKLLADKFLQDEKEREG